MDFIVLIGIALIGPSIHWVCKHLDDWLEDRAKAPADHPRLLPRPLVRCPRCDVLVPLLDTGWSEPCSGCGRRRIPTL